MALVKACRHRRNCRDDFGRVRVDFEELAHNHIRLQPDRVRIRADERAAEDPRRPLRDIPAFERFQQRLFYFRLLGDRAERNLLSFTPLAQSGAKIFRHAAHLGGHDKTQPEQ